LSAKKDGANIITEINDNIRKEKISRNTSEF
jgi:hypothetical protein